MNFKGMLCIVIEIKNNVQRNYNMTWYLYLETVENAIWISLTFFERLNFVKFQSNFVIKSHTKIDIFCSP